MRSIDILGLAAAIVIAGLAQIIAPYSGPWWATMAVAGVIGMVAAIHLIWSSLPESARAVISPAIWKPTGHLRTWVGILLLCVLMGGGYVGSHGLLVAGWFEPTAHQDKSAKPWVTQQEIDAQQRQGRLLLTLSPAEMLTLYATGGWDAISSYRGSLVKIDYPFERLTPDSAAIGFDVTLLNIAANGTSIGKLKAYFGPTSHAKVLSLRPNDYVRGLCLFERVERDFIDFSSYPVLIGYGCQLN